MTIDEAITILNELHKGASENSYSPVMAEYAEAFDMAIKGLKNMKIMCSFDRDSEEYDCD